MYFFEEKSCNASNTTTRGRNCILIASCNVPNKVNNIIFRILAIIASEEIDKLHISWLKDRQTHGL